MGSLLPYCEVRRPYAHSACGKKNSLSPLSTGGVVCFAAIPVGSFARDKNNPDREGEYLGTAFLQRSTTRPETIVVSRQCVPPQCQQALICRNCCIWHPLEKFNTSDSIGWIAGRSSERGGAVPRVVEILRVRKMDALV
jgi:hypothetical protein